MDLKWMLLVGIVTTILIQAWNCDGCWEQERVALLQLKSRYFIDSTASWPRPHSTGDDKGGTSTASSNSSDYCQWEGVRCNATTGRVVALSLTWPPFDPFVGAMIPSTTPDTWDYWGTVDASLFLPFQELRSLDLSGNGFIKWVDAGPAKLSNLESLDLSFNWFNDQLLQSLGGLTSLKSLNLSYNLMTNLRVRDLPNVNKLELLDLGMIPLDHKTLGDVGLMTSMKTLSLHRCGLDGNLLDIKGICQLVHMEKLDISNNNLNGDLPWCLLNMTSLQWLDISSNWFTGEISLSSLTYLTSLQYLNTSNNHYKIHISLSPLLNLSKLKYLDARNIHIYGARELNPLIPKFQLLTLKLHPTQGLTGSIPKFLYHQHDLLNIELSNLEMEEGSCKWLMENNTRLTRLVMSGTSIYGPLQLPVIPNMHLTYLDLSHNSFDGVIPEEIGAKFPRLMFLNLSRNWFKGAIPASISNMNLLEILDLSNNNLSGGIPEQWVFGYTSLRALILSKNNLQGQVFPNEANLGNLTHLFLNNNLLERIPDSLRNSSNLIVLDMSNNMLFGQIPKWMGKLQFLQVLDLSKNKLNGSLPRDFSPPLLCHLHLSHNQLQGPLVDSLFGCVSLVTLDLSHNQITSEISRWFRRLFGSMNGARSELSYLQLSYNNLEGGIPCELCYFTQLSLIDLSHNNLSGPIFPCLSDHKSQDISTQGPMPAYAISPMPPQEPLQFTTKSNSYSYSGKILESMSGIDLSCNKLTGEIPPHINNLWNIWDLHALNFSHNDLKGEMPSSMSSLHNLESLDLSYNSLSGKIPPELTDLYSLEVFSVAYNNFSGKVPDWVAQFGTFDESSYQGNPFLCGPPLMKSCTLATSPIRGAVVDNKGDDGFLDIGAFYITFSVSYTCMLLGVMVVLGLNPRWRREWLYFVELCTTTTYY